MKRAHVDAWNVFERRTPRRSMQRRRELAAAARSGVSGTRAPQMSLCVYISGHLPVLSVQVASPLDLLSNQILGFFSPVFGHV